MPTLKLFTTQTQLIKSLKKRHPIV